MVYSGGVARDRSHGFAFDGVLSDGEAFDKVLRVLAHRSNRNAVVSHGDRDKSRPFWISERRSSLLCQMGLSNNPLSLEPVCEGEMEIFVFVVL